MDDRLWVYDDINLIRTNTEEPMGFDDLEPFVHERGGVDRDLPAHPPRGMLQGFFRGDALKLRRSTAAEGST